MIKLKGNKKDGYILIVQDSKFYQDMAITYEEVLELKKITSKIL